MAGRQDLPGQDHRLEKGEQVSERVLVDRGSMRWNSFELFTVERETPQRLYGTGYGGRETFVDKSKVVLRNATDVHLQKAKSASAEQTRRIQGAREWFRKRMAEIKKEAAQ